MLIAWFADATNGIQDFFASVGNFGRVNTDELCVGSTCVTEEQFNSVFNTQSAAAGAPGPVSSAEAPGGQSASPQADADTGSTYPSTDSSATGTDPDGVVDEPPVPDDPAPEEAPDDVAGQDQTAQPPEPEPEQAVEAANDNAPVIELPATGTE